MKIKKLMIVDDDADDREFFLTVLEEYFPDVQWTIAENGKDALEKLTSSQVIPDLIVLDLNMPLMNGKQFLEKLGILDKFRNVHIAILTTSSDSLNISETRKLGAQKFITKPDKFDDWQATIQLLLNSF